VCRKVQAIAVAREVESCSSLPEPRNMTIWLSTRLKFPHYLESMGLIATGINTSRRVISPLNKRNVRWMERCTFTSCAMTRKIEWLSVMNKTKQPSSLRFLKTRRDPTVIRDAVVYFSSLQLIEDVRVV
jgi:hypothetical protein